MIKADIRNQFVIKAPNIATEIKVMIFFILLKYRKENKVLIARDVSK
jgi:hypothetical protein